MDASPYTGPAEGSFRRERSNRPRVPQIAPKKHAVTPVMAKYKRGAAEGRRVNGALCPQGSVVLGDVIDIGEPAGWCTTAERVSRLRE